MSLVYNLKSTIDSSRVAIAAAKAEAAAFEQKYSGYYAGNVYAEKYTPIKEKADKAINDAFKAVKAAADSFRREVDERFTLKGDELTADAQLLNSGIDLSQADLERMFDKAKSAGNHTMMELAWQRALKDNIFLDRPYFSKKDLYDAADKLERYANSALTDDTYFSLWNNPGKLATITPAAVHDWDGTEAPYRYTKTSNG